MPTGLKALLLSLLTLPLQLSRVSWNHRRVWDGKDPHISQFHAPGVAPVGLGHNVPLERGAEAASFVCPAPLLPSREPVPSVPIASIRSGCWFQFSLSILSLRLNCSYQGVQSTVKHIQINSQFFVSHCHLWAAALGVPLGFGAFLMKIKCTLPTCSFTAHTFHEEALCTALFVSFPHSRNYAMEHFKLM